MPAVTALSTPTIPCAVSSHSTMSPFTSQTLLFSLLVLLLLSSSTASLVGEVGGDGKVGGRTEIKDVANNKEVQDLGRFAVVEYDKRIFLGGRREGPASALTFSRVVEAQRQVVAGVKYFLKVATTDHSRVVKVFDAVVVVQPWVKANPKELLTFKPSAN